MALASMARKLFGEQPERAVFTLYGSFAATGSGHGTDKALVAGILGLATDDPRVADAFALAKAAGVQVDIVWDTTTEVAHPNTVDIRCESREGRTLEMRGVSIGGGAAVIRRINGIDVDITGERTSVVVHQRDERGVLAHIAGVLAGCGINIANANLHRTAKRGDAYTVLETDSAVDASVRELLMDHRTSSTRASYLPPAPATARRCPCPRMPRSGSPAGTTHPARSFWRCASASTSPSPKPSAPARRRCAPSRAPRPASTPTSIAFWK
ncbi:MAG: serine dehydratase beta chain [Adlercreutzia equolifaciens]